MRLCLLGRRLAVEPILLQFPVGAISVFEPSNYLELGYTNFDVIVIGAGGGYASGLLESDEIEGRPINWIWEGGPGGGGGIHRVAGLLALLPESLNVYSGRPGVDQINYESIVANLRAGGAGEASYFGSIAMASGGLGGRPTTDDTFSSAFRASGGAGGLGGTRIAGGGGAAGTAISPNGADGTWDGTIGRGGGGAASGVGLGNPMDGGGPFVADYPAGTGGRGAYNVADTSVSDTTQYTSKPGAFGTEQMVGGSGGGARATPLTGSTTYKGRGSNMWRNGEMPVSDDWRAGQVVLRLT